MNAKSLLRQAGSLGTVVRRRRIDCQESKKVGGIADCASYARHSHALLRDLLNKAKREAAELADAIELAEINLRDAAEDAEIATRRSDEMTQEQADKWRE